MLLVNCLTPALLANGFAARPRARGQGGTIFTSSVEAWLGMPNSVAFAASKNFVNRLGNGPMGRADPRRHRCAPPCPGDTDALRRSGMDPATVPNVMSPDEVARLALENITNGPVYLPSPHYAAMFKQVLATPTRDALTSMAGSMKK